MIFQVGNGERAVFFFAVGTVGGVFRYASLERGNGVGANQLHRAGLVFFIRMIQREHQKGAFCMILCLVVPCWALIAPWHLRLG